MNENVWTQNLPEELEQASYLWLTKPYILTQALKRVCQNFTVQVIEQQFTSPDNDEQTVLALGQELPFIRQVFLMGDEIPYIYGRVIIPKPTYQAYEADFSQLGSKPLGETLLYHRKHVSRSPFEYAYLESTCSLIKKITYLRPEFLSTAGLWARRSLFHMTEHPLLITEIFLPTLPPYVG